MFVALLLAVAVQDATPAQPSPPPVAAPAPAKPKKERQICRPIQNTVSRMGGGSECHTAAEWRRMGDGLDSHALDTAKGR